MNARDELTAALRRSGYSAQAAVDLADVEHYAKKLTTSMDDPEYPVVIGIDPGPTTGVAVLRWIVNDGRWCSPLSSAGISVFQCNAASAAGLFTWLLKDNPYARVAAERWVIGNVSRASKKDGQITRDLIEELASRAHEHGHTIRWRPAAAVKPWASDDRLAHAGLLDPTKGMGHARDAARHALYSAVKDYGAPDPMSRRAER